MSQNFPVPLLRNADEPARCTFRQVLREQEGLFSRAQARAAGISCRTLRHWVRRGFWQHLVGDVFAAFNGEPSNRLRRAAALLYAGPDAALTGVDALDVHGFMYAPRSQLVHVVVPRHGRRPPSSGFVRICTSQRPSALAASADLRW